MADSKNRFNLTILGIVSIVGIVAVFFSFMSFNNFKLSSNGITDESDLAGHAGAALSTNQQIYTKNSYPTYKGNVVSCDAGDKRLSCKDSGVGRNHGCYESGTNGCMAYEGRNNRGSPGCIITCQNQSFPNLVVTHIRYANLQKSTGNDATERGMVNIIGTVKNIGNTPTTPGLIVSVRGPGTYAASNGNIVGNLAAKSYDKILQPNEAVDVQISGAYIFPVNTNINEDFTVFVDMDTVAPQFNNRIRESNENDNSLTKRLQFRVDAPTCTDSDGGINPNAIGTMKQFETDAGQTDSCVDSITLKEYYCEGKTGKSKFIDCQNECRDGGCINISSNSKNKFFVIEDDGTILTEFTDGFKGIHPLNAAKKFYGVVDGDQVDFVVFFTNSGKQSHQYHSYVQNSVQGIGQPIFYNDTLLYGSQGKLQGVGLAGDLSGVLSLDLSKPNYLIMFNNLINIVLHEGFFHRWGVDVGQFEGSGGSFPVMTGGAHWSRGLSGHASSPLGATKWFDNGDGTFSFVSNCSNPSISLAHPFELYLMGLKHQSEIREQFMFVEPEGGTWPTFFCSETVHTVRGTKRFFTIDDLIAAAGGERIPSAYDSQKEFSAAFAVVTERNRSIPTDQAETINRLVEQIPTIWRFTTHNLSTMRIIKP